jgi:hypothetical protein
VTCELEYAKKELEEVLYVGQRGNFRGRSPGRYQGRGRANQGSTVTQGRGDKQWQTTVHCHKCIKTGHIVRTYPHVEVERKIRNLHTQLVKLKFESHETANLAEEAYNKEAEEVTVNAYMVAFAPKEDAWFLDSSASLHVTSNSQIVTDQSGSHVPSIRTANGQVLAVTAKGNVKIEELSGEIKTIHNVLYVPRIKSKLLSVGKFTDLGHVVLFNSTHYLIFDCDQPDQVFLQAFHDPKSKLYKVLNKQTYQDSTTAAIIHDSPPRHSSTVYIADAPFFDTPASSPTIFFQNSNFISNHHANSAIIIGHHRSTSKKTCPLCSTPVQRLGGHSEATGRALLAVQNDVYTMGVMMQSQKSQRNSPSPFGTAQFSSVNYFSSGFIFLL